jgi:hypothetical protein
MKVDNRYCKAFISDLKSCSYWNNSIGYMSDEDYKATCQALIVLEDIYEKMPDEVKSSDHRETVEIRHSDKPEEVKEKITF